MKQQQTLDGVDRGILHILQQDARNHTASDIADAVGVAPNTVRNRLGKLEENKIIEGYYPHIDYERAGYQLRVIFVCTVSVSTRRELAEKVLGVDGVVEVTEILSGTDNLTVEAVGRDSDELTAIASKLESIGLTIQKEKFVKKRRVQPFDQFGQDATED